MIDGTPVPISKYAPAGLSQNFSPTFFKIFSADRNLEPGDLGRELSCVGHEAPQANQGSFLDGKCVVLPLRSYTVLDEKGEVVEDVRPTNSLVDCVSFEIKAAGDPAFKQPAAGDPEFKQPAAGDPVFKQPIYVAPWGSGRETADVFVAACSDSAVLLSRPVPIGRVLINVEGLANVNATILQGGLQSGNSGDACGVLFRVAVSQERADFLGDVGCSDGAQCFLVQTGKASVTSMFGSDFLMDENGAMNEDKPLEEILGRDSEIDGTFSIWQGLDTISRSKLTQAPEAFFEFCDDRGERMWRKDSSSGCPFSSECDDKPDKSCYHCTQEAGSTCSDGCGGSGGPTLTSFLGTFDFRNSCCGHDFCYDSQAFSQKACDDAMFRTNVKLRRRQTLENRLIDVLEGPRAFANCIVVATAMRAGLRLFGKRFTSGMGLSNGRTLTLVRHLRTPGCS